MMRVALDSNILAYLAGVSRSAGDGDKITKVRELVSQLVKSVSLIAPAQTLGELFVVLLSEDMQHGFVTRGLTIVNPLADDAHLKLTALIEAS